jgi:hypothetical protein
MCSKYFVGSLLEGCPFDRAGIRSCVMVGELHASGALKKLFVDFEKE